MATRASAGAGFRARCGWLDACYASPALDDFIEAARVADLPVGRSKTVNVGGQTVALYHTARGFFASDDRCPHRGGPLAEGDLIGDEIVCPWHLWGFNLETGLCPGNPEISVTMHEVKVDGDRILVRLAAVREMISTLL
jgi:nitrite reductase (NADH) small subunit